MFDAGGARKCRCQALKAPGWIWRDTTQEQRDAALLEQTGCGTDGPTSGLIGYVDGEPAGWVAVESRDNYPRVGDPRDRSDLPTLPSRRRRTAGKCVFPAPLCCQLVVAEVFLGGVFLSAVGGCSVGCAGPGSG